MWTTVAALLLVILALLYWHFKRKFQFFKDLGITGPPPSVPLGNLTEAGSDGMLDPIKRWRQEFGRIFGYFEGPTPVLVISDPDVIKSILVTDFNNFRNRKPFPLVPKDPKGLFVATEDRWRWLRPLMSPSFTARKVRSMSHYIVESADALLEVMTETCQNSKPGDSVNIHRLFQGLTLDVIGKVAFGFQTDSLRNPNDRLLRRTQKVFTQVNATIFHIIAIIFPSHSHKILAFKNTFVKPFLSKPAFEELGEDLKEILALRKNEKQSNRIDFLQLMLNIQKEGKAAIFHRKPEQHGDSTEGAEGETLEDVSNAHDVTVDFTDEEIIPQSITILMAGYETTANMLAFTAYLLALNPHVQDRLLEEIDEHIHTPEMATCENTEKLQYLDMVVNEVLRMYSTAALLVTRQSKESCTYGDVHIPAGTNIMIDAWNLHYDPEYWPQPNTFDPERFTAREKATRHPYAFIPFGGGPRNCIGMRFALIEMKAVLVRVLQRFMFKKTSDTEEPLPLKSRTAIVPKNGILLEIIPRS